VAVKPRRATDRHQKQGQELANCCLLVLQGQLGEQMRRGLLLLLLISTAVIGILVYLVSTLIALLFETGLSTAIDPKALISQQHLDESHRLIPKILHQTWKNETVPEEWAIAQYTCLDLHPDYRYIVFSQHFLSLMKLWTDASSREFIKNEYPWFLPTFDSYTFNIQRADVIRYFALYHYGGTYLDLDLVLYLDYLLILALSSPIRFITVVLTLATENRSNGHIE
jgi:mannosyltransferase OCH1-like enzyme